MKKRYIFSIAAVVLLATCIFIFLEYGNSHKIKSIKELFLSAEKVKKINISNILKDDAVSNNLKGIDSAYYIFDSSGKKLGVGFIVNTSGFRGNIKIAIGVDDESSRVTGIKIISQNETPHYGGNITEKWFTDRFINKSMDSFLNIVSLDAVDSQDVVQVTGATMSSKGVIDGVNTAIMAYNIIERNNIMEKPKLNVEDEKKGEEETFYIKYDGDKSIKITLNELKKFPVKKVKCILSKSTGTKTNITAEGPILKDVLEKYGVSMSRYEGIGITARDGYYALISKDIMENRDIILGLRFDGKDIPQDEKPIRVVIPEEFGVYWVKMVSDVELYSDIPQKNIKSVKMFYSLTENIKPYMFEYFGSKDESIEVSKILSKFKNVNSRGFFTMVSSDGLTKNETITMVKDRYYIKIGGEGAPMNVMANFKLGTNVKDMAFFSTTEDAVIFPEEMIKITGTLAIDKQSGMPLTKVLEKCGITGSIKAKFVLIAMDGRKMELRTGEIKNCILVLNDKKVTAIYKSPEGLKELDDLLEINKVE